MSKLITDYSEFKLMSVARDRATFKTRLVKRVEGQSVTKTTGDSLGRNQGIAKTKKLDVNWRKAKVDIVVSYVSLAGKPRVVEGKPYEILRDTYKFVGCQGKVYLNGVKVFEGILPENTY